MFSENERRVLGFRNWGKGIVLVTLSLLALSELASAQDSVSLFTPCVNGTENGLQVDINGVATPGSAVTLIGWNWGDGATTTGPFPQSHTYASAGTYSVQVTAQYNDGTEASSSLSVTVESGLVSNCEQLTIIAGDGGEVIYQASVGSGLVTASSPATLYLAVGDDLNLVASPSNSSSFQDWSTSGSITGPGTAPVAIGSVSPTVVVTDLFTPEYVPPQITANFETGPSSTCSAGPSTPQMIPLIPGTSPNAFWTWTPVAGNSNSPFEPFEGSITTGIPLIPGSNLVDVSGDLWNLSTTKGGLLPPTVSNATVTMAYSGALSTSATFSVAPWSLFLPGVVGYPNLTYGYSPQASTVTPENASLALPMQLSAIPNLWSMVNYSLGSLAAAPLSMNLAYDIWITKSCQQNAIFNNDIELMIWPYSRYDSPIGLPVGGTYTVPTWINGSLVSAAWVAFVGQKAPGELRAANSATTVSFFLLSPAPAVQAYVGVNISAIIEDMVQTLVKPSINGLLGTNWTNSQLEGYYLNNISFGSEFRAMPNLSSKTLNYDYSYSISDFCFVISPTNSSPDPGSWSSSYSCTAAPLLGIGSLLPAAAE